MGIVAGAIFIKDATNLFPKAAPENNYIQIVDKDGKPITSTKDPNVYLKITLPEGWTLASANNGFASGKNNLFVKEVKAQETLPACPKIPGDVGAITLFKGTPSEVTTYDVCIDDKGGTNATGSLCADGAARFRCYYSQNFACISGATVEDFNYECPSATVSPSPIPRTKLAILNINNNDGPFSYTSGGSSDISTTSNFGQYLDKVIPWRLNDLKPGEDVAKRSVQVIFETKDNKRVFHKAEVYLTTYDDFVPSPSPTPHIIKSPVPYDNIQMHILNTLISSEISNYTQVDTELESIINSVNNKLAEAKTIRRVKLGKKDVGSSKGCANSYIVRPWAGKDISLIYSSYDSSKHFAGIAYSQIGTTCLNIGNYNKTQVERVLFHELGHIFGLYDYYLEQVHSYNNKVITIGINPRILDTMFSSNNFELDPVSVEIINRTKDLPIDVWSHWKNFIPNYVDLKLVDTKGVPMSGVTVEVFPQIFNYSEGQLDITIPNNVSFSGITNSSGIISLGEGKNIFTHSKERSIIPGTSALLRITNNGESRYAALTGTDLLINYFAKDAEQNIIPLNFYSLVKKPAPGRILNIQSINQVSEGPTLSEAEEEELNSHLIELLKSEGLIQ